MLDRFERFSYAIFEVTRCWHKLAAEVMEPLGLRGPHAMYLVVLLRSTHTMTAARLSEVSGRDKADVSRAISLMTEKGLITRDGPAYRASLTLTEEGRQVANSVCEKAAELVERAGAGYSEEQRQGFYQVLETITKNMKIMTKDGN